MSKAIIHIIFGILAILAVAVYHVPGFWIFSGVVIFLLAKTFNPFRLSVENVPEGFTEKKFDTGEVVLNYVEGPDNGPPLLFIPGQMEFWQGYMPIMPHFSKKYYVFVIDIRGHGKSTRTPGRYSYNICGEDLKAIFRKSNQEARDCFGAFFRSGSFALACRQRASVCVCRHIRRSAVIFFNVPKDQRRKVYVPSFSNRDRNA